MTSTAEAVRTRAQGVASEQLRLPAELFVLPLSQSEYLIYAPLRRAALIGNAPLVRFLRELAPTSQTPPSDVARALVPGRPLGPSRLISTRLRVCDKAPQASVGMGADAAGTSACATSSEKVGLEAGETDFDAAPEITSLLRSCGILAADEERAPAASPTGPPRPTALTLLLTSACNLRCRYCYAAAGEAPPAFMRPETARRAIDFVAANAAASGAPSFEVNYHAAGEPTMHWKLLVESHLYARGVAQSRGLRLRSSLTTNGVLTAEKRAWIVGRLDSANVSFDGLPEVQDANRRFPSGRGSSDIVLATLRAFDRAGFRYSIRMTVAAEAVPRLAQSVAFLCRRFRPRAIQVEPLYRMGRGRDAADAETAAFIEAYRAARRTSPKAARLVRFSGARLGTLTTRFCGVANDNFCVSPAGNISACHEVADERQPWAERFFYGRPSAGASGFDFDEQAYSALRTHTVDHLEHCGGCFAKWSCAGDCYHKALHWDSEEFAGAGRCEISRALTKDQILEKIAASGGVYWKGRRTPLGREETRP